MHKIVSKLFLIEYYFSGEKIGVDCAIYHANCFFLRLKDKLISIYSNFLIRTTHISKDALRNAVFVLVNVATRNALERKGNLMFVFDLRFANESLDATLFPDDEHKWLAESCKEHKLNGNY